MLKQIMRTSIVALMLFFVSIPAFAATVIVGGETIGISIHYEGVMISGTYLIYDNGKVIDPSLNDNVKAGDMIIAINNQKVNTVLDMFESVKQNINGSKELTLTMIRDGTKINRTIQVVYDSKEDVFKTGLLIKDKISGIGTVTFYNPETKTYGSLGHEINDSLTGKMVEVSSGSIFESNVVNITKSVKGSPGEKIAIFNEEKQIGSVLINSKFGIYGNYTSIPKDSIVTIETAQIDEIKLGKATILTVLQGNQVQEFEIEITELKSQSSANTKGIVFKITDERLLSKTNGIIQGMSGSPIIQNGKLIGAVTHVIVDKVDYGYGMYIEWMLEEEQNIR